MPEVVLREVFARNLGVIGEARLELSEGFSVLTGETGAGKTLLLGALELSLGRESASSRLGLTNETQAAALFERNGSEIVFVREASATGRLRSTLNGVPSSAEGLRTLADELIVIHGQHDSLSLRSRGEVLRLVDSAGNVDTDELSEVRRRLREARSLRERGGGDAPTRARELEFIEYQLRELEEAALTSPEELANAMQELERLSSLRDGQSQLIAILEELDGEGDDALLGRLAQTVAHLPRDGAYDEPRSILSSALDQAREATRELTSLADPDAFDLQVMADLEARVSQLQLLIRKYGSTLAEVFASLSTLAARRQLLMEEADRASRVDEEIAHLESIERDVARRVRRDREYAAARLSEAVRAQLPRVALANASLRFAIDGDDGSDAQILFCPNPGQVEGPLASLASGGELSRVLLAISLETASRDVVAVFDEIDAGVGGQVAQQIGECLSELAKSQQVLAVTHLASVAARADHHFVIEKTVVNGVTRTAVRRVDEEQRVGEIARMLSGTVTEESRALAAQLLSREQGIRSW
ncbi:MAG TPA: AAA family ATPase [Acidimicrobiales bacterium]|nr:AAA family ATPase [Acidimicrobiales bacterium]